LAQKKKEEFVQFQEYDDVYTQPLHFEHEHQDRRAEAKFLLNKEIHEKHWIDTPPESNRKMRTEEVN
jgi:hypothetical protein